MTDKNVIRKRPKRSASQQVDAMKRNGIKFEQLSEAEAIEVLRERNFFFKLKAYEKVFDRYSDPSSPRNGTYINLDFGHLVELSRLDKALRFCVMETALDIEHFMKVQMNRAMMDDDECDGYEIVERFFDHDAQQKLSRIANNRSDDEIVSLLQSLNDSTTSLIELYSENPCHETRLLALKSLDTAKDDIEQMLGGIDLRHIEKSIMRLSGSQYSRNLAKKYGSIGSMAYWNFIELATFGDIISFYIFYFFEINNGRDKTAKKIKQLLFPVRTLRNAAAHNSCLLNTLRDRLRKPLGTIAKTLIDEYGMDHELVQLTRRVPLIHDFSALMICYDTVVSSKRSRDVCSKRLMAISSRLSESIELFSAQAEVYNCLKMLASLAQTFTNRMEQPARLSRMPWPAYDRRQRRRNSSRHKTFPVSFTE